MTLYTGIVGGGRVGFVFGLVSAFSPEYYLLPLFRALVGFGIGGGFLG